MGYRYLRSGLDLYTKDLSHNISTCGQIVHLLAPTNYQLPTADISFELIRKLWPMRRRKMYFTRLHWLIERLGIACQNGFVRNSIAGSGNYDIVHMQSLVPPVDQFLLSPIAKKVPLVMTVHDTIPHGNAFVQHKAFQKRMYKWLDMLIVHYEKGKNNLIELYGVPEDRIEVIPHGLTILSNMPSQQHARKKLGIPADKKVLLFFGTIRSDKGLDILLRSLPMITDRVSDILLVIAGKAPGTEGFSKYNAIIDSLGLEQNILRKVQFIPHNHMSYYFCASNVCVIPYTKFDSQSGVLMQAYVHYKPVVVTDVGAIGDMVREDGVGIVVNPNHSALLADGITRFFQDPLKYEKKCSRAIAEKYSWCRSAEMTIKCYKKLLLKRHSV